MTPIKPQTSLLNLPIRKESETVLTFKADSANLDSASSNFPAAPVDLLTISFNGDSQNVQGAKILVEPGARARLLLRYDEGFAAGAMGPGSQIFRTALEINLATQAQLELFVVSILPSSLLREAFDRLTLEEGSRLVWTDVGFDAGNGTYERHVDFIGEGSEMDFAGAYGAANDTEGTYILTTRHRSRRSKSRVYLKSALKDSAHLIFRGLIHIEETAAGSDAYLSNRNLVLNDGVRAESLPQLKIETNDVVCSHGSATGGPRAEELFYLMSRGLDPASAKSLLVQAHLSSILDRLSPETREDVEQRAYGILGLAEKGSQV